MSAQHPEGTHARSMLDPGVSFAGLDDAQLKALRGSAIDQLQTAIACWNRAGTGNAPLADTLTWAGSINAAERRIDRINAELGRRGASA